MLKATKIKRFIFLFLCISVALAGCKNLQASYSAEAYQQAVSLKVETLALIDKATNPYKNHEDQITVLEKDLRKAYEYAKGRPNNQETTQQWSLMRDPEGNLLAGFLKRWEEQGSMPQPFVAEAKEIISDAFDTIIELESGKR